MSQYLPKAWREAGTKPTAVTAAPTHGSTEVNARVNMSEDIVGMGYCPVCQKPMTSGFVANGHPVQVCLNDRIALPLPNTQPQPQAPGGDIPI